MYTVYRANETIVFRDKGHYVAHWPMSYDFTEFVTVDNAHSAEILTEYGPLARSQFDSRNFKKKPELWK